MLPINYDLLLVFKGSTIRITWTTSISYQNLEFPLSFLLIFLFVRQLQKLDKYFKNNSEWEYHHLGTDNYDIFGEYKEQF